jgi:hypothetical protein
VTGATAALIGMVVTSRPAAAATVGGVTSRVSVSSNGRQGNADSGSRYYNPDTGEETKQVAISAGGRFVAFASEASDLVRGDTNAAEDVFVRDRLAGMTRRVSVASSGQQANGSSFAVAIRRMGGSSHSPRTHPTWCPAIPTGRRTSSSVTG